MSNTIAATEGAPPCLIVDDAPGQIRWREDATVLKAARVFGGGMRSFPSAFQSYPSGRGGAASGAASSGFPFQRRRGSLRGGAGARGGRGGRGGAAATAVAHAMPAPPSETVDEDGDYLYAPCTPPPEIEEQK